MDTRGYGGAGSFAACAAVDFVLYSILGKLSGLIDKDNNVRIEKFVKKKEEKMYEKTISFRICFFMFMLYGHDGKHCIIC